MRSFPLCLLAMTLAAAAAAADTPAASLEGYWYGKAYQPALRETTQELMHRRADGSYEIEFRLYRNCELVLDQKETGRWSVKGRLYHTDTLTVNGSPVDTHDPSFHDDYEIEKLDAGKFTYRHVRTGVRDASRKVDANFIFPACNA